jgi:hypothetical protein
LKRRKTKESIENVPGQETGHRPRLTSKEIARLANAVKERMYAILFDRILMPCFLPAFFEALVVLSLDRIGVSVLRRVVAARRRCRSITAV